MNLFLKFCLLFLFASFWGSSSFGSNSITFLPDSTEDEIYTIVEQMPLFAGAQTPKESDEMRFDYVSKKAKLIKTIKKGTVYISYVVNKKGKVVNAKVIRGYDEQMDAMALKIIEEMPKYTPGMHKGENVSLKFIQPIYFK